MAYVFVAAALFAVISIVILYKVNLEKIRENPEQFEKIQTSFFIGVAIAEAIPIILLVFGLASAQPVENTGQLYAPGLIIILLAGFGALFMYLQKKVDVEEEARMAIHKFAMIAISLVTFIPIASLVGLMTMMP
ncbi:hypothetical protein [Lentibacillus salicampi]|uniref:Uncharacterized protein n=1 Tax=Lentibacillus salicampi TaxID=175306 RepID=A0A4Y9A8Y9_9BACI|nr:hypothetical protein [Lentibacillus salicampi]TFJ91577.1 hypothetical protein E4U82_16980 [Lentibacillus salicampi]